MRSTPISYACFTEVSNSACDLMNQKYYINVAIWQFELLKQFVGVAKGKNVLSRLDIEQ